MASALGRTGDKCNYKFLILERQGHACDVAAQAAEEAHSALLAHTVSELKGKCRAAKLPVSGTKDALVNYLLDPGSTRANNRSRREEEPGSKALTPHQVLVEAIAEFNRMRADAADARRELITHRQAAGFQTGNHKAIEAAWSLPPRRAVAAFAVVEGGVGGGLEEEEARNRTWWFYMVWSSNFWSAENPDTKGLLDRLF